MALPDYVKKVWQNLITPINESSLNNLETGVDAVTDTVRTFETQGAPSNGRFPAPAVITTSRTIDDDEYLLLGDATSGTLVLALPTAIGIAGKEYLAKKVDVSSNLMTLSGFGGQLIDGQSSISTDVYLDSVSIFSDGANWRISSPPGVFGGNVRTGTGAPSGVVVGSRGDLWLRTDGGANTTLYVKETGDNTTSGWQFK